MGAGFLLAYRTNATPTTQYFARCTWHVDEKGFARSYLFGDHWFLFESLRNRSAMASLMILFVLRKIPRWHEYAQTVADPTRL